METIKSATVNNPESWDATLGEALPFKCASNEDAKRAAAWLNELLQNRDALRAQVAELVNELEYAALVLDALGGPSKTERLTAAAHARAALAKVRT